MPKGVPSGMTSTSLPSMRRILVKVAETSRCFAKARTSQTGLNREIYARVMSWGRTIPIRPLS